MLHFNADTLVRPLSDWFIYPSLQVMWPRWHNPFQRPCLLVGGPCSNHTGRYRHITLSIAEGRIVGFKTFPRVLVLCDMHIALSRIWTQDTDFISYDSIHYTMNTSKQTNVLFIYVHLIFVSVWIDKLFEHWIANFSFKNLWYQTNRNLEWIHFQFEVIGINYRFKPYCSAKKSKHRFCQLSLTLSANNFQPIIDFWTSI